MVFGSESLTLTNQSLSTAVLIPGLAINVTVPASGVVYMVTTNGGVETNSNAQFGYSQIEVGIFVDGTRINTYFPANQGGEQLVMAMNSATVTGIANWSMSMMLPLSPGNHVIQVGAQGLGVSGGSNSTVSGTAGSLLQGQLIVLALAQ